MKTRVFLLAAALALAALVPGCSTVSSAMKDGYYKAEASSYNQYGWKDYVLIYVSGDRIITVEYDAFNQSGFCRSWDIDVTRAINQGTGTYPSELERMYAVSLLNWQNPWDIDTVSGATDSLSAFQKLSDAVLSCAKTGDKRVALVNLAD